MTLHLLKMALLHIMPMKCLEHIKLLMEVEMLFNCSESETHGILICIMDLGQIPLVCGLLLLNLKCLMSKTLTTVLSLLILSHGLETSLTILSITKTQLGITLTMK